MYLTVAEDYLQETQHPFQGKIYYDSGELCYEGCCVKLSTSHICSCGIGIEYYKDGVIKKQGLFQRRLGLWRGYTIHLGNSASRVIFVLISKLVTVPFILRMAPFLERMVH